MKKFVYHGSMNGGIKELIPNKSTHMKEYVYATDNPAIALIFSVLHLGDFDFDLRMIDGKVILTERLNATLDKYSTSGYLYKLDATNFKHLPEIWECEVVSTEIEPVIQEEFIPNVLDKLNEYVNSGSLVIYRYPNKPSFIPSDDSDLVDKYIGFEKMGHIGAIDNLILYFPHLKDLVYSKLGMPNEVYFVGKDNADISVGYDNIVDAILGNCNNFIREDGWLNYHVTDGKIVLEKGTFDYSEPAYLYKLIGKFIHISAHSFNIIDCKIEKVEIIDFNKYMK